MTNQNSKLQFVFVREKIINEIQDFFYRQNFHEVITPVLNETLPNEPNLHPFTTEWKTIDGKNKYYLPMSPERNLKILLAQGIGNCFSFGHCFRNLEQAGSLHTPEFLMLEWYRVGADYKSIMNDVKELLAQFGIKGDYPEYSLPALFKKYAECDVIELTNDIEKRADYDQIFCNQIEPHLPKTPCFITDFPSSISPLAKPKKDNPQLAERFEFYLNGIELGNGNTENTDWQSVKKMFEKQKEKNGMPIDEEFIRALKTMDESGETYAGIGLGIDRLAMLLH